MARKKKKSVMSKLGVLAFFVGSLIALIVAIINPEGLTATWAVVLAALGLVVGLLNISESETSSYLAASVAFIIAAWAFMATMGNWGFLATFMHAVIIFTAPGTLVVSFRALYTIAKD